MQCTGNALVYRHDFCDGPGGWLGWESNAAGAKALVIQDGAAVSSGPWWIDYNHAPPGGGYLNLLFALHTVHGANFPQLYKDLGGLNTFVTGGFPLDFTNARITVEVRGDLTARGAQMVLLAQAKVGNRYQNHVLIWQPIDVKQDWSPTTLRLLPDDSQWVSLGSRHDRTTTYGHGTIRDVLHCLNGDIIFVLYPLDVRPLASSSNDPHILRAGEDYAANPAYLPEGSVEMRSIQIEFTHHGPGDVELAGTGEGK
jgi:hypothetical protein